MTGKEGIAMNEITQRKVSISRGKIFLTGKVEDKWNEDVAAKWQILGIHQWIMEPYETKDGIKYKKVLNGPYPETVKRLLKGCPE